MVIKWAFFLLRNMFINMLYQMLKWLLFCKIIINRAELWHKRVNPKCWKYLCFVFYKTSDLRLYLKIWYFALQFLNNLDFKNIFL